jgi:hypothetical protein
MQHIHISNDIRSVPVCIADIYLLRLAALDPDLDLDLTIHQQIRSTSVGIYIF